MEQKQTWQRNRTCFSGNTDFSIAPTFLQAPVWRCAIFDRDWYSLDILPVFVYNTARLMRYELQSRQAGRLVSNAILQYGEPDMTKTIFFLCWLGASAVLTCCCLAADT
ncbi:MAG: hypothetical protein KAT00_07290, partial [Planctomycetes bacterium]|nr:hypothetical protein [Planctomycetota bacterium]